MLIFALAINHTGTTGDLLNHATAVLSQFCNLSFYSQDRQFSHFPVYLKDHLFNSNPGWDFGAFRRLEILVKQTNFNSSRSLWVNEAQSIPCLGYPPPLSFHDSSPFVRFAHVFSERGKYVFVDSAVPDWSTVVAVSEEGTECDPRSSVFQPMTPEQLVRHGIVKQHRLNLLPDWGVIVGVSHHRPTDIFYFHLLGINGCK